MDGGCSVYGSIWTVCSAMFNSRLRDAGMDSKLAERGCTASPNAAFHASSGHARIHSAAVQTFYLHLFSFNGLKITTLGIPSGAWRNGIKKQLFISSKAF